MYIPYIKIHIPNTYFTVIHMIKEPLKIIKIYILTAIASRIRVFYT